MGAAVLALAAALAVTPAVAAEAPATIEVAWIHPDGSRWGANGEGQLLATDANLAALPCGVTVLLQHDVYPFGTPDEKARTEALWTDPEHGLGRLLEGEDYGWAQSWRDSEYSTPACEPVLELAVPALPSTVVQECYLPGEEPRVVLTDARGIRYDVVDVDAPYGDKQVIAWPVDGFVIDGAGALAAGFIPGPTEGQSWYTTVDLGELRACAAETPAPTETPAAVPSPDASAGAVLEVASAGRGAAASTPILAETGVSLVALFAGLALALTGAGVKVADVLVRRRRAGVLS